MILPHHLSEALRAHFVRERTRRIIGQAGSGEQISHA
jgi:hypothetical protein